MMSSVTKKKQENKTSSFHCISLLLIVAVSLYLCVNVTKTLLL